jgi:hypothetical protein
MRRLVRMAAMSSSVRSAAHCPVRPSAPRPAEREVPASEERTRGPTSANGKSLEPIPEQPRRTVEGPRRSVCDGRPLDARVSVKKSRRRGLHGSRVTEEVRRMPTRALVARTSSHVGSPCPEVISWWSGVRSARIYFSGAAPFRLSAPTGLDTFIRYGFAWFSRDERRREPADTLRLTASGTTRRA